MISLHVSVFYVSLWILPLFRQGVPTDWHGHVTALTVHTEFRRLGLAGKLMKTLEDTSERRKCFFVDLFVRASNTVAVSMYNKLGYVVYRRIKEYYSPSGPDHTCEDALDMRKALSRDKDKRSMIPVKEMVSADDVT